MVSRQLGLFMCMATSLVGCGEGGGDGDDQQRPFRDACRTVIDQPFDLLDAEGEPNILALGVGGVQSNQNFANRGDVIVEYAQTDRITVEMCRFTMARSEKAAELDFDKLDIWAYATDGSPKKPSAMDPGDNCVDEDGEQPWIDGCSIRVYYDGQDQQSRSGADLRVTIPHGYIHVLAVTTEDNIADADYQNRGDVCIEGLQGSADVMLGSGRAFVVIDEDANFMPGCPAELRAACDAVEWDPEVCQCSPETFPPSGTRVQSHDGAATDITVDLPSAERQFWASIRASNDTLAPSTGAPACSDDDAVPGARCDACVDPAIGRWQPDPSFAGVPSRSDGSLNKPSLALEGGGYSVQLNSETCRAVADSRGPDAFVGKGNGTEQELEERGNLTVCSGCVRSMGCDALLGWE